jgi:hypothetical protein
MPRESFQLRGIISELRCREGIFAELDARQWEKMVLALNRAPEENDGGPAGDLA